MGKLIFEPGVPTWLQRETRKQVKRMHLSNWAITVTPAPQDYLRKLTGTSKKNTCLAAMDSVFASHEAIFYVWDQIQRSEQANQLVEHELLHLVLLPIRTVIEQGFGTVPILNVNQINRLAIDAEEQVIAHLLEILTKH